MNKLQALLIASLIALSTIVMLPGVTSQPWGNEECQANVATEYVDTDDPVEGEPDCKPIDWVVAQFDDEGETCDNQRAFDYIVGECGVEDAPTSPGDDGSCDPIMDLAGYIPEDGVPRCSPTDLVLALFPPNGNCDVANPAEVINGDCDDDDLEALVPDLTTWLISSDDAGDGRLFMYTGSGTPASTSDVVIPVNGNQVWVSPDVAAVDTVITGVWVLAVFCSGPEGATVPVSGAVVGSAHIGYVDSDGAFQPFSTAISLVCANAGATARASLPALEVTIPAGTSFALLVKGGTSAMTVKPVFSEGGATLYSMLIAPDTDPGHPVPNVATIAMVAAGALMVAGAVYVRRK